MKKLFFLSLSLILFIGFQLISGNTIAQVNTISNVAPANTIQELPDNARDGGCAVVQPAGSISEGEACGDDINGGCNMTTPAFTSINPGDVVFGSAWHNSQAAPYRDTDWFEMVLTETTTITMSLFSNASYQIGLIVQKVPGVPGCDNIIWNTNPTLFTTPCEEGFLEPLTLEPGTYYFFVGLPFSGPDYLCSSRAASNYIVTFAPSGNPPAAIPLSDWALYIGIFLIGTFVIYRYKRSIA